MTDDRSIDTLSLKELGALATSLGLKHWSRLRKAELVSSVKGLLTSQSAEEPSSEKPVSKRGRRSSKKAEAEERVEAQPTLFDVDSKSEPQSSEPAEGPKPKRSRKSKSTSESATPLLSSDPVPVVAPAESVAANPSEESETSKTPVKKARRPRKKRDEAVDSGVDSNPKSSEVKSEPEAPVVDVKTPTETPVVEEKAKAPRKRRSKKAAAEVKADESVAEPAAEPVAEVKAEEPVAEPAAEVKAEEPVVKTASKEEKVEKEEKKSDEPAPKKRSRKRKTNDVETPIETAKEPQVEKTTETESNGVAAEQPSAPAEPVPAPKRRRGGKNSKAAAEAEPSAPAETPAKESGSVDEKKPAKPVKEKKNSKKIEEKDLILWNWDDEEEYEKDVKVDEEDDDLDDSVDDEFDEPDSSDEIEPASAPESVPETRAPSKEAMELKERLRRQKFVGGEFDRVDRLALSVCDPYWLHACWEITTQLVDRVRSAMGRYWHTADPILRVFLVDTETKSAATCREHVSDVAIRGGVDNWYVPVDNPPSSYMVELGYRSRDGQFFTLISSNVVTTPQRFVHDTFGRSSIGDLGSFAPMDVRSSTGRAPFGSIPTSPRLSDSARSSSSGFARTSGFDRESGSNATESAAKLRVDTEIVIKGQATPGAVVSIKDEPIRLRPDGTFSVRYSLPERRHVFPVVTTSPDGIEKQTVVLAIDRNTKTLDPVFKEDEEE